jgi:hypothetical protein
VRQNGECVAAGPEPIPAGQCPGNHPDETYLGSSGYRLIPGNTCVKHGHLALDEPKKKDCSKGMPFRHAHNRHVLTSNRRVPTELRPTASRQSYTSTREWAKFDALQCLD